LFRGAPPAGVPTPWTTVLVVIGSLLAIGLIALFDIWLFAGIRSAARRARGGGSGGPGGGSGGPGADSGGSDGQRRGPGRAIRALRGEPAEPGRSYA